MRGFSGSNDGGKFFQSLVTDHRIIHWFAENHDLTHPRLSTLPTGLTWVSHPDDLSDHPDPESIVPILQRPLKVFVSDRLRGGSSQWNLRLNIATWCEWDSSAAWCEPRGDAELNHKDFLAKVVSFPFIACPHGGGIDPSPKAWEALLVGAIPIIQHSPLDDAYERFPVMFVSDWQKDLFEHPDPVQLLTEWRQKLAPHFEEGSALRRQTLERLRTAYWVEHFRDRVTEYEERQKTLSRAPSMKPTDYIDGWESVLNDTTKNRRLRVRKRL